MIAGNQRCRPGRKGKQPFRVGFLHMERARPDFGLVFKNVQWQVCQGLRNKRRGKGEQKNENN
jgi:hypothetical protein